MPTGTGKSGLVALLSRCLSTVNRTLELTPREALVEQMSDDVLLRFWTHLGCAVQAGHRFTADAPTMGAELQRAYVETLLPSRGDAILQALQCNPLRGTQRALRMIRLPTHRECV
jgi:hypothetical protein